MSNAFSSLIVAVFCVTLAFAQQSANTIPVPPAADSAFNVKEDLAYGTVNGSVLHLDVYQPSEPQRALRPAVILIHGGGWNSLDKSTMRGMGQFLARNGFVAFAVDYRLFDGEHNHWPAQLDDVQRAVRWIRANAGEYRLNPALLGAFGHSAGGQLAALLGMLDTRDNSDRALATYSSRVQAVVDVSGPSDFTTHDSQDPFLARFFGTSYAKDPDTWSKASPARVAAKGDAPFLLIHGTQDESVPIAQSEELQTKLQAAGVPVTLIKVDDVHTFRTPQARRQLAVQTLAFFSRYLLQTE